MHRPSPHHHHYWLQQEANRFLQAQYLTRQEPLHHFGLGLDFGQPS